ncbi:hypothetical protein GYMLUDRAFT_922600 [Collybiopsis luxurians FD-317 M1]|uniref:Uncharacterized protein n=1 Tax=Collybiopsis luxurians FD-317 M1 TaxID=944289 RepID=A0A0D0CG75_9AGAR|nr:hypothetical protein GYMLUDRAFT_922600 [Collybiopsis luxurians FD-317 M1]
MQGLVEDMREKAKRTWPEEKMPVWWSVRNFNPQQRLLGLMDHLSSPLSKSLKLGVRLRALDPVSLSRNSLAVVYPYNVSLAFSFISFCLSGPSLLPFLLCRLVLKIGELD